MASRSRSPKRDFGVSVAEDVQAAHALRERYAAPRQSKFRVSAILRFVRTDGSCDIFEAVNAEPHDANIRGAICAERVALCQFQKEELQKGSRVVRVVCATDCEDPIFPGPLCREFLTATCDPGIEVVATGSKGSWEIQPLKELLPLPSLYRRLDNEAAKEKAAAMGKEVKEPEDPRFTKLYQAAAALALAQGKQTTIYPLAFAAAASFEDGRICTAAELKGIEYGCTVDAVSLLLPELVRARKEGRPGASAILQVDNYGLAHAPFAAARSLLIEHGFGEVLLTAHSDDGKWAAPIPAKESLPHANFLAIF